MILVMGAMFTLGLLYVFNYPVLITIYPNVSEDYSQYVDFASVRFKLYDMMFACAFWVIFMVAENKIVKAFSCFFMIVSSGSFIDKAIFHLNKYLISDIALVIVALIISIRVYVRKN